MNQRLSTIMRVHPLLLCTALSLVWPLAQSRAQVVSGPSTAQNLPSAPQPQVAPTVIAQVSGQKTANANVALVSGQGD